MRAFIASSIGATCAAVLVLPAAVPAGAAPTAPAVPTAPAEPAESSGAAEPSDMPGSTQSLPMSPLPEASGRGADEPARTTEPAEQGLPEREVRPFSLVGVVWDDAGSELQGTVQVRTRAAGTTRWSDWQDLETHNAEHAADPGTDERESGTVRGSTAPLWVGESDGVAVRVRPEASDPQDRNSPAVPLPTGLRLELVDPGKDPQQLPAAGAEAAEDARDPGDPGNTGSGDPSGAGNTGSGDPSGAGNTGTGDPSGAGNTGTGDPTGAGNTGTGDPTDAGNTENSGDTSDTSDTADTDGRTTPVGASVLPALSKGESEALGEAEAGLAPGAQPYIGPRPRIITRKGWGADEKLRERAFVYTKSVKAAFIHHSATGNNYTCSQAPSVLRGIYRYHVKSSGWRDIGYNFAVDKCGNIYEGRAGGVTKAVLGAHTLGFNTNSMGIAVLGTFTASDPPAAAVNAVAKLTAWKLGLFGADPSGKVTLVSGGGNKFKKGTKARLNVISGHRDGFATECPGARLYKKLGSTRTSSARLQGR
ncbi:N-acetylmuramoyl-L-alanine amidase [Streptomyces sp. NPDC057963]|uniref:peptidoglycan recognition protein family protein n=1 Tax=Streptomyces sp. NPDC057963 TaxID=3346290 RepID=UPI0036E7DE90